MNNLSTKKRIARWLIMPLIMLLMSTAGYGQLIFNGSLNGTAGYANVPFGWTNFSGTCDTYNTSTTLPAGWSWIGSPGASSDGGNWVTFGTNESFQQTVSGLTIGQYYTLSYYYANTPILSLGGVVNSKMAPAAVTGTGWTALTNVNCPQPSGAWQWTTWTGSIQATSTTATFIFGEGTASAAGSNVAWMAYDGISLAACTPPAITTQPQAVTCNGSSTGVNMVVTAPSATTYLWEYSDNNGVTWNSLAGLANNITTATATLTGAHPAARKFRCTVSNSCGPVISNSITVTTGSLPVITSSQPDFTICGAGSNKQLTVSATGTNLTYEWFYSQDNGATWATMTTAPFTTNATTATVTTGWISTGWKYRCVVTSSGSSTCTATSAAATATVGPVVLPVITTQPQNVFSCGGNFGGSFTVAATGTGLSYSWEYSPDNGASWGTMASTGWPGVLPGAATLTIPAGFATSGFRFRATVTSSTGCSTISSSAIYFVSTPPAKPTLSGPTATNTCPSTTANIQALVTGSTPAGTVLEFHTSSTPTAGNLYSTPTAATAGTYFAFYRNTSTGCYSSSGASVTASIGSCVTCNAGSTAPVLSAPGGCGAPFNLPALVTSTPPAGTAVEFHTSATPTPGNKVATPASAPAGTYFAFYFDATNNCYSPNSQLVTVDNPVTPTLSGTSATNPCGSSTADISTLVTSSLPAGTTVEFHTSSTPTAGNLYSTPSAATAGNYFAFYVSTAGCFSPASAAITVTITVKPTPADPTLAAGTQPNCLGNGSFTISNFSAGNTYTISPSAGVTQTGAAVSAPAGTYTVTTVSSAGCAANAGASITLTQLALPTAPTLSSSSITNNCACSAVSTVNLNTLVTSTAPAGTALEWHTGNPATAGNLVSSPTAVNAGSYFAYYFNGTCYSAASPTVVASPVGCSPSVPDLSPTIDIDVLSFNNGDNQDFVVNLFELNNIATSGSISFKIAKLSIFTITYPTVSGSSNVFGGTVNENSNWTFTEDANFIYVTSKPGISILANSQALIGFHIVRTGGSIFTTQNLSASINNSAGGETDASDNGAVITLGAN